jgi:hypothetical protein
MGQKKTEDIADGRKTSLRALAGRARDESDKVSKDLDRKGDHATADRVAAEGIRSASALESMDAELRDRKAR